MPAPIRYFYFRAALLALLIPVGLFAALGSAVSHKYEVSEGRIAVELDRRLTYDSKLEQIQALDEKGRRLKIAARAGAATALLSAMGLVVLMLQKRRAAKRLTESITHPASQTLYP
ncbi:hypothetical protein [Flaviaesturariibacter amylovorans]|uniref:Uncharacterized protein n=1 Tax=Flaviaesturariibacter amylovorans TaxID=1084520 RepID=A0ABP8HFE3_9BACT